MKTNKSVKNRKKLETRKDRIKNKSIELILASSSHGLPRIFRTKRKSIKIMWLFLFILFSIICIYMVYSTIINYLKYEVITKIDVTKEIPAEFPAVTIINLRNTKCNASLSKIMIACQFSNQACNENDFEMFVDKLGYVSYKFKKKLSYLAGAYFGLSVLIKLKDDSNQTGLIKGLRLIVHNHSSDPDYHAGYSQEGYNIAAGFQTDLAVSRVFSQKLGEPYGSCLKNLTSSDSFDSEIYKFIFNSTRFNYSQRDCFNYCIGKKINDILNISDSTIKNYIDIWSTLPSEIKSKLNFELIIGNIQKYCENYCPLECDSIRYDVTFSFARMSNETFYDFIQQYLNLNFSKKRQINAEYLENLVYFNVYYHELEYTHINQLPKMDFFDLISNIGGNLGLFIGISFLSFAELIELAIETIHIYSEKKNFTNIRNG